MSSRSRRRHSPGTTALIAVAAVAVVAGLTQVAPGIAAARSQGVSLVANQNQNQGQNQANGGRQVQFVNGLQVLARDCNGTPLKLHSGFQEGRRCVTTAAGEVSSENDNPTVIITSAPRTVRPGQAFDLKVSSRNLVRDRFLGAAAGGYYLEASLLNSEGLNRGHLHTACRMLNNTNQAPQPGDSAFFKATEDNKGGRDPDTVTITVTGLPSSGIAQCAVWAGDGSHRVPMMEKANEIPAFDSVRIQVT